jgi:hypothetical protein
MRNGLVVVIAVLMTLVLPRVQLTVPAPSASCRARSLARQPRQR